MRSVLTAGYAFSDAESTSGSQPWRGRWRVNAKVRSRPLLTLIGGK